MILQGNGKEFYPKPARSNYDIGKCSIECISDRTYSSSGVTQSLDIKDGPKTLRKDVDYTVAYKNNINAGTASVSITGTGIYGGTVKNGSTALLEGKDYTVTYKNNKEVGEASLVINDKGNYTGTIEKTFKILPKSYTSSRLSGKSRFNTATAIAKEYSFGKVKGVVLANAYNFPDALSGSSLASKYKAPIILVNNETDKQKAYLDKIAINKLYILGGDGVIDNNTVDRLCAK